MRLRLEKHALFHCEQDVNLDNVSVERQRERERERDRERERERKDERKDETWRNGILTQTTREGQRQTQTNNLCVCERETYTYI